MATNTEEILMRVGMDITATNAKMDELLSRQKSGVAKIKTAWSEFGMFFSGAAVYGAITKTLNHFDDLQDKADNLSVSTDFLQGMSKMAGSDVVGGVRTFDKALNEVATSLGKAKSGAKDSIESFLKYGITLEDIVKLDTEGMFYRISDVISSIPDPAQRAAAAFDLLGKSGKNMAGFMGQGAKELKAAADAVDKLDANKIRELANAKGQFETLGNTLLIWGGKIISGLTQDLPNALGKASALSESGEMNPWQSFIAATDNELIAKNRQLLAEQKNASKEIVSIKEKELELQKAITNEKSRDLLKDQESITEKMRGKNRVFASISDIAGRDFMEQLRANYGKGGAMDTASGTGQLALVARQYEAAKLDQEFSAGRGWTKRAEMARSRMESAQKILENYGAIPKTESVVEMLTKLASIDNQLADLEVTIVGTK